MLRLITYDLRRRRERILVFIVITLLIEIAMWTSSSGIDSKWGSLTLGPYFCLAIAFIFVAVAGYYRNLKSYQRRLLPVTPLQTVLSPILFAILLILIVIIITLLHSGIYFLAYRMDFLPDNILSISVKILLQTIWSSIFLMTIVMFSITVALSMRFKGRVWVGIVLLTLLQNVVSYLEMLLFDSNYIGLDNSFTFVLYKDNLRPDSGVTIRYLDTNQWPLLFEMGVACILIYGMVVLVKKRIEV